MKQRSNEVEDGKDEESMDFSLLDDDRLRNTTKLKQIFKIKFLGMKVEKTRLINKPSSFLKCAIKDPDLYVNKQYLPAINNVLAKFKKFFFHYSTTPMVTNSENATNPTNKLPEENKSKNKQVERGSKKKMEYDNEKLTAKIRKKNDNLLYSM